MKGNSFWDNLPVLVTGITGFVGSTLAKRLVEVGAYVIGFAPLPASDSYFFRLGLDKKTTLIEGSVEDISRLERILKEHSTRVVFHLAAQAIVGEAYRLPLATFATNIGGTWNLLEAARANSGIQAIVVTSTDKVYGASTPLPFREDLPLNPRYPYEVSMACADLLARSYFCTYGLPVAVARFANLYGPGDLNFSRIIPDTIRRVLEGMAPVIRSGGTPARDYLYIEDAVNLYLLLAERIDQTRGEVFNAGNGQPISVLELVKTILQLAGRPDLKPEVLGVGSPAGEIDRTWLDATKARRLLGWRPRVPLEEGLRRTLAWYQESLSGGE